jgi:hypothetical protein
VSDDGRLAPKTIYRFYYPLALSWLFMGLEGPVCIAVISHLREPDINTAAFSILISMAMWIESPVIDLLATATTLARGRSEFYTIRKFVLILMAWVTVAQAAITFTPLYWIVTERILGVHANVAEAARPGMMIMLVWSACVAWRRFLQGVLIRDGQTRVIGTGTFLRMLTIASMSLILFLATKWSGLAIAATALFAAVLVEMLFVHLVSRRSVAKLAEVDDGRKLTMRQLAKFHFPLAATTLVKLMVSPIIVAGLARTVHPTIAIAAFQVANTLIFLFRALGFCLPEVVITLYRDVAARGPLRRFTLGIAGFTVVAMLLLSVSGGARFVFGTVLGATPEVVDLAFWTFVFCSLAPALDALQAYCRGVLTAHHLTVSRMFAVIVSVAVLLTTVQVGVTAGWTGPMIAGISLTIAQLAEFVVLAFSWNRARSRVAIA